MELATRSDEVARLLEAGDNCGAAAESARLRAGLTAAISRDVVPPIYLEDLSGVVNEIQALMPPCEKRNEKRKKGGGDEDEGDD